VVSEIDSQRYYSVTQKQLASIGQMDSLALSSMTGNTSSAVRLSKSYGVQYIIKGTYAEINGHYYIGLVRVDCLNGKIEKRCWAMFTESSQSQSAIQLLIARIELRERVTVNDRIIISEGMTGNDLINIVNPDAVFSVSIRTGNRQQVYCEGEFIDFAVSADEDCYITLITVDPKGAMTLLLPNKWQPRAFLQKGQTISIPGQNSKFRFPILPPHGQTLVKVIASLKPLRLSNVSTKSIEEQDFVSLPANTKAIGIEGISDDIVQKIDTKSLCALLNLTKWATDELIILTAE
jgi:hypothetical protein